MERPYVHMYVRFGTMLVFHTVEATGGPLRDSRCFPSKYNYANSAGAKYVKSKCKRPATMVRSASYELKFMLFWTVDPQKRGSDDRVVLHRVDYGRTDKT